MIDVSCTTGLDLLDCITLNRAQDFKNLHVVHINYLNSFDWIIAQPQMLINPQISHQIFSNRNTHFNQPKDMSTTNSFFRTIYFRVVISPGRFRHFFFIPVKKILVGNKWSFVVVGPSGAMVPLTTRCWWFELWPKGSEGAWRRGEFLNLPFRWTVLRFPPENYNGDFLQKLMVGSDE